MPRAKSVKKNFHKRKSLFALLLLYIVSKYILQKGRTYCGDVDTQNTIEDFYKVYHYFHTIVNKTFSDIKINICMKDLLNQ